MGYYYNIFSCPTIKFVAITMLLIIAPLGQYSLVAGACDPTAQPTSGACYGYYGYCVVNVITALRDVTPNSENYHFTKSFPKDAAPGGVAGWASCVVANGLKACQDCLRDAFNYLSSCSSGSASYDTAGCFMNFSPI